MKVLHSLFITCLCVFSFALNAQTITYRFTSENNCEYNPLDSVYIENLSQIGDTTLYYPDTVLNFTFSNIDIQTMNNGLKLHQNYPNPFSDKTYFDLYVPESGDVKLSVYDLTGRLVSSYDSFYKEGLYSYLFTPGNGNTFILTAQSEKEFQSIAMIATSSNLFSKAELTFLGEQMNDKNYIKSKSTIFPYSLGDNLSFTGYFTNELSLVEFENIMDSPTESTNYTFVLNDDVPEQPGTINGQHMICTDQVQNLTYSVEYAPGLEYNWTIPDGWTIQSGEGTHSINILTSNNVGTVSVNAENSCGTSSESSIEIIHSPSFYAEIIGDTLSCHGDYIELTVEEGIHWIWIGPDAFTSQAQTINIEIDFAAVGLYTAIVFDEYGCRDTISQFINILDSPIADIECTQITTCTLSEGELTATVTGGTPPYYYYFWNTTGTSNTISDLPSGNYSLTVQDINGCWDVEQGIVLQDSDLSITASTLSDVSCYGFSDGVTNAAASGGTQPYDYLWSTGLSLPTHTDLPSGTYSVTVTDANGCTANAYTIVSEPDPITVSILEIESITCYGESNGTLAANSLGGDLPYSLHWSNGPYSGSVNSLSAGTYSVTITDGNGCTAEDTYELEQPEPLTVQIIETASISCFGGNDGALTANVSGGTLPMLYNWDDFNPSSNQQTFIELYANNYQITVADANSCLTVSSYNLLEPDPLEVNIISTGSGILCYGESTANLTYNTTGGSPFGYNYYWNMNGEWTQFPELESLSAGEYSVTVTDDNGCTNMDEITIGQPDELSSILININNASSSISSDGSIEIEIYGGVTDYTIDWGISSATTGEETYIINDLSPGEYNIIITDENNCIFEFENSIIVGSQ